MHRERTQAGTARTTGTGAGGTCGRGACGGQACGLRQAHCRREDLSRRGLRGGLCLRSEGVRGKLRSGRGGEDRALSCGASGGSRRVALHRAASGQQNPPRRRALRLGSVRRPPSHRRSRLCASKTRWHAAPQHSDRGQHRRRGDEVGGCAFRSRGLRGRDRRLSGPEAKGADGDSRAGGGQRISFEGPLRPCAHSSSGSV